MGFFNIKKSENEKLWGISILNGNIRGELEVYNEYLKITYNNYYHILYYNQITHADKYSSKGNIYFYIGILLENGQEYQEHWQISNFLKGTKLRKIINYINEQTTENKTPLPIFANENNPNHITYIGITINKKTGALGRHGKSHNTITTLSPTHIVIRKLSTLRKKERGEQKIPYENIVSTDYDTSGTLSIISGVDLTLKGSETVSLNTTTNGSAESFYNLITDIVNNYNKTPQNNTPVQTSNADELKKWFDLYNAGVITKEEFETKKKELL